MSDEANKTAMEESAYRSGGLCRRDLLKGVAAVSLGLATGAYGARAESARVREPCMFWDKDDKEQDPRGS